MVDIDIQAYLREVGYWLATSGLQILLIVVALVITLKAASLISTRLLDRLANRKQDIEYQKRAKTLQAVVHYLLSTILFAVAVMMILGELGIEIGPILAAAGVVGLAVGFGAQNLVQDVLGGFFILLEDQIRVGDVVEIAGKSGAVEEVNLRMVILRDLSGNVHYIRNGQIDIVTNMTKDFSRYVFDVCVAYRENTDEVVEVLRELDEELRKDPDFSTAILDKIEILGVDRFADSGVIIKARTRTRASEQWRVGREFNRRLKRRFDELDIQMPFPHVTLYMGQGKDGGAPPLRVQMDGAAAAGAGAERARDAAKPAAAAR